MKNYFKKDKELKLKTTPENAGPNKKFRLFEKQFEKELDFTKASNLIRDKVFGKKVAQDHSHLTGKFRVGNIMNAV